MRKGLTIVTTAVALSLLWCMSFALTASAAERGSDCSSNSSPITGLVANAHPVVIVHGWTGSAASMQNLRAGLEHRMALGWQFLLFDYHDASAQWADSPAIAGCLADYLERVSQVSQAAGGDGQVYVVTHSLGGLAARFADVPTMLTNGSDPKPLLGGLVTLDTPHAGSPWGGLSKQFLSKIPEHIAHISPDGAGIPLNQAKARVCLAVHNGTRDLPTGCAYPPYLPGNVPIAQIAGDMTLERDIFGIHLYDVPLSGDSIVTVPSSQGYYGSDGPYKPNGTQIDTSTVKCTLSLNVLDQAIESVVSQAVHHSFLFAIDQMEDDSDLMDAIQQNKIDLQQVEVLLLADAVRTRGNECSHANIPNDHAAMDQIAVSLRNQAEYWKQLSDVTMSTLQTAQVPADCRLPAQRLSSFATTVTGPDGQGGGSLMGTGDQSGTANAGPAFADFAHLGYRQALSLYLCNAGGVEWPAQLLLTGTNGVLLSSYDLGAVDQEEHADVTSIAVSGSTATIDWVSYEGAGSNIIRHRSSIVAPDGQLVVKEDPTFTTLGIPTSHLIDISSEGNIDGSWNEFTIGDGNIVCGFQPSDGSNQTTIDCQSSQNFGSSGAAQCPNGPGTVTVTLSDTASWNCGAEPISTGTQEWNFGPNFATTTGTVQSGTPILPDGRGLVDGNVACVALHATVTCKNMQTGTEITLSGTQASLNSR